MGVEGSRRHFFGKHFLCYCNQSSPNRETQMLLTLSPNVRKSYFCQVGKVTPKDIQRYSKDLSPDKFDPKLVIFLPHPSKVHNI